jgi:Deoxyribonuclease II
MNPPRAKQLTLSLVLFCALGALSFKGNTATAADAPAPLLAKGKPVEWWFVYKFNAQTFPACGAEAKDDNAERMCPFGGEPASYRNSQQFVFASNEKASFTASDGCAGTDDPVAETFEQIYNGNFRYVVWNDQFYKEPKVHACTADGCPGPWGHSKGVLAWNDEGDGVVVQVTTPAWPGVAVKQFDRKAGNTLGCIKRPNNIQNAQHFFALKLSKSDLLKVLEALENASVVTDTERLELVNVGESPKEIRDLVMSLGQKSANDTVKQFELDSGVTLVSKPSALHVPPWQMLSSVLDSVDLKAATWWASPQIPTTSNAKKIGCWDESLNNEPGAVQIAITGKFGDKVIGLVGGQNHAKVGVSTSGERPLSIFGDLNQQGTLTGNCKRSQNGRGGMFYVLENADLFKDMTELLDGKVAPTTIPKKINAKD